MSTKATLTLNVTYGGKDATDRKIRDLLVAFVEHGYFNGLLSGDEGDLEVWDTSHSIDIQRNDPPIGK